MKKVVRIHVTTNVRRVGNGTYVVRTTTSSAGTTRTASKTVRVR